MVALAGLCLLVAAHAGPQRAPDPAPFRAKVIGVTDGDTMKVLHGKTAVTVRLYGIDAPEKRQPFAERARQRLSELAFSRTVTVLPRGRDRYGRILASVVLPGNQNLNEILVAEGLAWWYRRYAPRETRLESIEEAARDQGLGLWAEQDPTPPWMWRRSRKP